MRLAVGPPELRRAVESDGLSHLSHSPPFPQKGSGAGHAEAPDEAPRRLPCEPLQTARELTGAEVNGPGEVLDSELWQRHPRLCGLADPAEESGGFGIAGLPAGGESSLATPLLTKGLARLHEPFRLGAKPLGVDREHDHRIGTRAECRGVCLGIYLLGQNDHGEMRGGEVCAELCQQAESTRLGPHHHEVGGARKGEHGRRLVPADRLPCLTQRPRQPRSERGVEAEEEGATRRDGHGPGRVSLH